MLHRLGNVTLFLLISIICVSISSDLSAEFTPMFHGHIVSLGPEYYHVNRTKEGGTKQSGSCWGVRANYDHIKRYNIYWGGQAFYGTGTLDGHTGGGSKIRSRLVDGQVEGSVGYTLQAKCSVEPWITPIVGYGYFYESNKFKDPSPLKLKYTTKYAYVPFGFLSGIMLCPEVSLGINLRVRYPIRPKCYVSDDPDVEDHSLLVGEKFGYRVEAPLVYKTQWLCNALLVGCMGFYDQRNYGGRENYPYDFIKTTLHCYGANIQAMYQF